MPLTRIEPHMLTFEPAIKADVEIFKTATNASLAETSKKVIGRVSIKEFGAKTEDEEPNFDNTNAIQNAIDYASTFRKGTTQTHQTTDLIFPNGVYNVAGNLTMSDNYKFCNLIGEGVATLNQTGTGVLLFIGNNLSNGIMPVRVKNLFFRRADRLVGTVGLKVKNASNGYYENLGSNGFETAFQTIGCINNLWDFKRNFIHNTSNGFVADISVITTGMRFDSNLMHIKNVNFGGVNGITLKGEEQAGGTGSGGLVKLSFCTFEGLSGTALDITRAGELKGLDTLEVDHCWFEGYGTVLANITYSKVMFKNCFIAGSSDKVIVLKDSFSEVHFEDTTGYFLDTAPTSGCLIDTEPAFEIIPKNISLNRAEFRGLSKATNNILLNNGKNLVGKNTITDNSSTMSMSKTGNVAYRVNLSTLTGGSYKVALMEINFTSVDPSFGTRSISKYLVQINGLSVWNISTTTMIAGANLVISESNATNKSVDITITNAATRNAFVNVTVLSESSPSIQKI